MSSPRPINLHFLPIWRHAWLAVVAYLALLAGGPAVQAAAPGASERADDVKKRFDIPAGKAFSTLKRFFSQSGEQVIYRADALDGVTTAAVKGAYTPLEALERMLKPTGFSVTRDNQTGVLAIKAPAKPEPRHESSRSPAPESSTLAKKKTKP